MYASIWFVAPPLSTNTAFWKLCVGCGPWPLLITTGGCTVVGDCVYSPNYPADYANYDECDITALANGALVVHDFGLEYHSSCAWDYFLVGNVRYCGTSGPEGVG